MSRLNVRGWRFVLPLAALALGTTFLATSALGASSGVVRVAVMTDCKGAFGGAYEAGAGGANIALAQFAGGKPKNNKKPSAGITGAKAGGKTIQVVGYGCGDDTPATILKETRRLMQQAKADVMVGPLSGDEAVAVANWAKARPTKTVIIGTAGSQDPTLQIAPKNVFRYHGDGAQWNAGIGEILYKKNGWRKAAIIADDYSFGWTSAAGIIADFCAIGGEITKRVFPPLNTTDYSSYVRQLPPPSQVDGYFWVVGGTGTGPALKAFEQAYGTIKPEQHSGNLFLWFLTGFQDVAPRLIGSYVGGFGTGAGPQAPCGGQVPRCREEGVPGAHRREPRRRLPLQLLSGHQGPRRRPERVVRSRRGEAAAGPSEDPLGSVQRLEPREREARLEPAVDPGPVAGADREGRRRQPDGNPGRVRTQRRPVVRRSVHEEQPAARPHAACVREEDAAVAGQDP